MPSATAAFCGRRAQTARGSRHECADPLVFCGTCPAAGAAPRPQEALLPLPGLQSRADRPGRLRPDEDRLPQVRGDILTENLNTTGGRFGAPSVRKVPRGGFSVRELSDSLASRRFSFLHCADSPLSECTGFPAGLATRVCLPYRLREARCSLPLHPCCNERILHSRVPEWYREQC